MLLLTLVVFLLLVKLGLWQLQRAEQKQQRLNQINRGEQSGEQDLHSYLKLTEEQQTGSQLRLEVAVAEQRFWLDNRFWQGKAGYQLLVPVRPVNQSRYWLLNLGWFARPQDYAQWPEPPSLPETLWISVVSVPIEAGLLLDARHYHQQHPQHQQQFRVQTLDVSRLKVLSGLTLASQQWLLQANPQQPSVASGKLEWQWVSMPPQRHRAYAVQWFGLAAAELSVATLYYLHQLVQRRRKRHASNRQTTHS